MVPPINLAISSCQSGRRSIPLAAIFVSVARPMRSAQGDRSIPVRPGKAAAVSRGIRHQRERGRCELRRDLAAVDGRTDMVEPALQVGPYFTADIGPALAEGKILAEIGAARRID